MRDIYLDIKGRARSCQRFDKKMTTITLAQMIEHDLPLLIVLTTLKLSMKIYQRVYQRRSSCCQFAIRFAISQFAIRKEVATILFRIDNQSHHNWEGEEEEEGK